MCVQVEVAKIKWVCLHIINIYVNQMIKVSTTNTHVLAPLHFQGEGCNIYGIPCRKFMALRHFNKKGSNSVTNEPISRLHVMESDLGGSSACTLGSDNLISHLELINDFIQLTCL